MKPPAMRHGHALGAAVLAGAGLGGFLDGIVLHQLLQWHHLLSHRLPPTSVPNLQVNMFWDGVFHLGTWLATLAAIVLGVRHPPVGVPKKMLLGGALAGWGIFHLTEGLINHHWLELHHVREQSANPACWDYGFLGLGMALAATGCWLVARARQRAPGR